jgi:hypothetical protein
MNNYSPSAPPNETDPLYPSLHNHAPPTYSATINEKSNPNVEKFRSDGYNDLIWAILFILHLVIFYFYSYRCFNVWWNDYKSEINSQQQPADQHLSYNSILLIVDTLSVAIFCSIAYLIICRVAPNSVIQFTLYVGLFITVATFILAAWGGNLVTIILTGLLVLFNVLYIYSVQNRIAFSAALLSIAAEVLRLYPTTILIAVIGLIMQCVWSASWLIGLISIYYYLDHYTNTSSDLRNFILFCLFVSFYWTGGVVKNIVHTTACGVMGYWYYYFPNNVTSHDYPVWNSFRRACTNNLGSIALGSLIVAIIRAMRAMVQYFVTRTQSQQNPGFLAVCLLTIARCILDILDSLVSYVNAYAYVEIAIYNKNYCEAAQTSWNLLRYRGLDAVINDSLISGVVVYGSVMVGLLTAALTAITCRLAFNAAFAEEWLLWAIFGFLAGFTLSLTCLELIEGFVIALFVCLAADPAALAQSKPAEYNLISDALLHTYSIELSNHQIARNYT